jgi:hypothetical protein
VLHLMLRGGAGRGDRALDLGRRQRQHGDVALARGQTDHAARVRHQDRRPRELVLGVQVLEHEHRRRVRLEEAAYAVVDRDGSAHRAADPRSSR